MHLLVAPPDTNAMFNVSHIKQTSRLAFPWRASRNLWAAVPHQSWSYFLVNITYNRFEGDGALVKLKQTIGSKVCTLRVADTCIWNDSSLHPMLLPEPRTQLSTVVNTCLTSIFAVVSRIVDWALHRGPILHLDPFHLDCTACRDATLVRWKTCVVE